MIHLSTVEAIEIKKNNVICDDFGKDIRDTVSNFLKKEMNHMMTFFWKAYIKNDTVSKSKYLWWSTQAEEIAVVKKSQNMQIKECTRSLQVCVDEKLNDRCDKKEC